MVPIWVAFSKAIAVRVFGVRAMAIGHPVLGGSAQIEMHWPGTNEGNLYP